MNFSAAELVKRSASQLVFLELKKLKWQATQRQIKGNKYAEKIVLKEQASSEKRGILPLKEDLLFFCIDMVKGNLFVEIKMVDDENNYEDWYLNSSILQSTLYATLLTKVKTLDTPKFRKKEGFKQEIIKIPKPNTFELWFGKNKRIEVYKNKEVFEFYVRKMEIIRNCVDRIDFEPCREFDLKYKFKEFSILKPKYKEL